MRDILFGAAWMCLMPLTFYAAHLGVLLWIWIALLSPNDLLYTALAGVPFNKIIALVTFFVLIVNREKKKFYCDKLMIAVGLYVFVLLLSYIFEEYQNPAADVVMDKEYKILILAVLMTGTLWSKERLHQAAIVVSLGFGLLMAKEAIIFIFTAGGHTITGTPGTGDNNGLALAVLMTIPIMLFAARYTAVQWVKRCMQIVAGLGAVTVIATFSRGGFVGMMVLAFMLLQGSKRKIQTFVALAVVGIGLFTLAPDKYFHRVDTITTAAEDDSFTIRLVAWKINTMMALDHPLLGAGPNASLTLENWMSRVEESSTFLFPTPPIWRTFVAHSIYFQTLGDTGFTGLFLFLVILAVAYGMTKRTQKLARGDPALAWAVDLGRALQISITVYCVSGAALSLVYFEFLFIMLAMISRTHKTVVEQTAESRATAKAPVILPARQLVGSYRRAA